MRRLLVLLPVLIAFQAGVPPALAWTWPAAGPVLRPFTLGDDPYAGGQHRGVDIAGEAGTPVRAPAAGVVSFAGTVPGRRARRHRANGRRILGDARASGLDRGRARRGPVRRSDRRRDRPDRRRRAPRALRPSRDTADVGPARLPRSAVFSRGARGAPPAGAPTAASRPRARGGSGLGAAVALAAARASAPGVGETGPGPARIDRRGACKRAALGRRGGAAGYQPDATRPPGAADGRARRGAPSTPAGAPTLVRACGGRSGREPPSLRVSTRAAGRERRRPLAGRGPVGRGCGTRWRSRGGRSGGGARCPRPPARQRTAGTHSGPCARPALALRRRRRTRCAVGSEGWSDLFTEISRASRSRSPNRFRISIGMTIRPSSSRWRMMPVVVFVVRLRLVVSIRSVLGFPRVVDGPRRSRPADPMPGCQASVPVFAGLKPPAGRRKARPYDGRR